MKETTSDTFLQVSFQKKKIYVMLV